MAADLRTELSRPFDPSEIRWRVGSVARSGKRATLLAYIDARAVMDRLDDVCGVDGWRNEYATGAAGGIMCTVYVRVRAENGPWSWIGKTDGAENTQIEAVKGGISDAFKRAAVLWGIGRYLYRLDASWHDVQDGWANGKGVDISHERKHVGWVPFPRLPAFALPDGSAETSSGGGGNVKRDEKRQARPSRKDDMRRARGLVSRIRQAEGSKDAAEIDACQDLSDGLPVDLADMVAIVAMDARKRLAGETVTWGDEEIELLSKAEKLAAWDG